MTTLEQVADALGPMTRRVAELDLSDPDVARQLEAAFPHVGLTELRALLVRANEEGVLTPKRAAPTLTFGRIARPSEATANLSIDAVDIQGVGAEHTHPRGEVSLCFALEGSPRFDGHPEGWVVLPPGSHHAPTVRDGRMLIVYFLPDGAVVWGPATA